MRKILSLIASLFVASNAFAWTPTVEVVRTQAGAVQLKAGGWTTQPEMNDMNWSSYRVWMLLNGQEFDVTAAVVSLFTSGHPSVTFALNGHFELNIALLQYFGIDPLLYPIGMEVCKLASAGGECASSRESLVKRKPTDFTANATCYPDPTCATPSGAFSTYPRVLSSDGGLAGHSAVAFEVILDKSTVITGMRIVGTNSATTGVPNNYGSGSVFLNIHSTFSHFGTSALNGDLTDRASGTVTHWAFGAPPLTGTWRTDIISVSFASPLVIPAGTYVFSPMAYSGPGGSSAMYIMMTTVGLGTDYYTSDTSPGIVGSIASVGGSFVTRNTAAVDLIGY